MHKHVKPDNAIVPIQFYAYKINYKDEKYQNSARFYKFSRVHSPIIPYLKEKIRPASRQTEFFLGLFSKYYHSL